MDPLFGYVDEQPGGESTGNGPPQYTISFPNDPSQQSFQIPATVPATGGNGVLHHHQQNTAQISIPATTAPTSQQPIFRVVTSKSETDQQVYVIKLENILQPDNNNLIGCANDDINMRLEDISSNNNNIDEVIEDKMGEADVGEHGENSQDEIKQDEEDDDKPDPFLVVEPEAVIAMGQSVGVELNEDDASYLGCMAINNLRHCLLIALQFSQKEHSPGITVDNFAKAEKQLGNQLSLGQQSVFRETFLKYAAGYSLLDDGPEMDLNPIITKGKYTHSFDDNIPSMMVYHLLTPLTPNDYCQKTDKTFKNPFFNDCDMYTEPVVTLSNQEKELRTAASNQLDETQEQPDQMQEDADEEMYSDSPDFNKSQDILSQVPNCNGDNTENNTARHIELQTSKLHESNEWSPYLKALFEEIVYKSHDDGFNYKITASLKIILKDLRRNGAYPIFHVICETFRDYMKNKNLSVGTLFNMLAIADTLVSSDFEYSLVQMTDLGSMLVEMIILPPSCEVNLLLINIFMKVLKVCNELLTWTCTYVTEMLKGMNSISMDYFMQPMKCTLHGALCLVNGLEDMKIQIAQEFGWHTNILNFSRIHSDAFIGQSYCQTKEDSFLEEEILKFYHNFFNNYTNLVTSEELSQVRVTVANVYGTKFASFPAPAAVPPSSIQPA